jgi:hypothetical protein
MQCGAACWVKDADAGAIVLEARFFFAKLKMVIIQLLI